MSSSLPPIELQITGNNEGARKALQEISNEAKAAAAAARAEADAAKAAAEEKKRAYAEAARAARDASKEGKDAARQVANAAKDEADAARDAAKALEENARAAEKVSADRIKETTRAIRDQGEAAKAAHAQNMQMAERGRNFGAGVALAGVGGIALTNNLANDAQEGAGATARLDVMFHKIGETDAAVTDLKENLSGLAFDAAMPDDDPLNSGAAALASFGMSAERVKGLMNGLIGQTRVLHDGKIDSLGATVEAAGRAFGKGDVSGLARVGVTLDESQLQRIQDLKDRGASQDERQAAVYEILKQSFDKYALSMTEGMSQGEIAANRQALALDGMREAIGAGSSEAKQQIDGMTASIFKMVGANPELAKGAGLVLAYGSYAGAGVGGVVAFASQLFLAVNNGIEFVDWLKKMKAARIAAAAADAESAVVSTTANTTVTESLTTLTNAEIRAAEVATGIGPATVTGTTEAATAVAGLIDEYNLLEQAEIRAAGAAKGVGAAGVGAAGVGAAGVGATGLGAAGVGGAAAGAPAAAVLLGLSDAYNLGSSAIHGATDKEIQDQGNGSIALNANLFSELTGIKAGTAVSWLREKLGFGVKDKPKAAAPAPVATPRPSMALPSISPLPSSSSSFSPSSSSPSSGDVPDTDLFGDEIRSLERAKRDLKGKGNAEKRDQLQKQIDGLQDNQRKWRSAHSADMKAQHKDEAAAKKAQREAEQKEKADNRDDLLVAKARIANSRDDQIEALNEQLDAAKDANDKAKIAALTTRIADLQAMTRLEEALAAADAETDAHRANAMREVARLNFEHDKAKDERMGIKAARSGGEGGGDTSKENDAALRAMLSMHGGYGVEARMPDFAAASARYSRSSYGGDGIGRQGGDLTATATTSMTQNARGERTLQISIPPVPLGYGGLADVEVS